MNRLNLIRALAAAAALDGGLGPQAAEARPSMSRGEQFLQIDENTCEKRAYAAYAAEGWNDIAGDATWVKGHKGDLASYTTCNAAAGGGVVVNIFVAYGGSDPDGSIAGGERTRLQDRMEKPN